MKFPYFKNLDDRLNITGLVSGYDEVNGMHSNGLRVLAYHRIADPKGTPMLDPRLISATPEIFEKQMHHLVGHYHPVSLEEVLSAVENDSCLPKGAVLITFDDAYVDFVKHAWPILRRLHLPATIFVPTAYPDQPDRAFWWDRLYRAFYNSSKREVHLTSIRALSLRTARERKQNLRRLQNYLKTLPHDQAMELVDEICAQLGSKQISYKSILSWDELRQLASEGVAIGAHTQTHPILTRLAPEQIRIEIIHSQKDLKREIGKVYPVFCYPNGDCDDEVVNILREEGIIMAFTMQECENNLSSADSLRLCRTSITKRTSPLIFRLRLMPLFSYLYRWMCRRRLDRDHQ